MLSDDNNDRLFEAGSDLLFTLNESVTGGDNGDDWYDGAWSASRSTFVAVTLSKTMKGVVS